MPADLQAQPAVWVKADPKQIVVTVIGPAGDKWSAESRRAGAQIEVHRADLEGGTRDEVALVQILGGNGTLVTWNVNAKPGAYVIQLSGRAFPDPVRITFEQTTMPDIQRKFLEVSKLGVERSRRVEIVSLGDGTSGPGDFMSAIAGNAINLRLSLVGAPQPVRSAKLTAIRYRVDPARCRSLYAFSDRIGRRCKMAHPSKFRPPPRGEYVYRTTMQQPGDYQVDVSAEGAFANGQSFSATTLLTLSVHRKIATLTRVRQQRSDRDRTGNADSVRFLLDVDVVQPGIYQASIRIRGAEYELATGERALPLGKQTLNVEAGRELFAKLSSNPNADLLVRIEGLNMTRPGEPFGEVMIQAPPIKAGQFESPAPGARRHSILGRRFVAFERHEYRRKAGSIGSIRACVGQQRRLRMDRGPWRLILRMFRIDKITGSDSQYRLSTTRKCQLCWRRANSSYPLESGALFREYSASQRTGISVSP